MRQRLCPLLLACVLAAGAASSGEPTPDVIELLARAREAWQQGDALERGVRAALNDGAGDYARLLDLQDKVYAKARRLFEEALKAHPDHPQVLAAFGSFWLARHEFVQARKYLEAALRASHEAAKKPPAAAFLAADEADVRRALGGVLERAGDTDAALDHYRKAFNLDDSNLRNRLSLAIALCAAGMPQDALPLLKPWAETQPPSDKGAKEGSAGAAAQAASGTGTQALGLYTLAVAQEETGFLDDALASYRKAGAQAVQAGHGDTADVASRADMAVARLEDCFDAQRARAEQRAKENEERRKKKLEPLPDEQAAFTRASVLCDQGCRLRSRALDDAGFRKALAQARAGGSEADTGELEKHPAFDGLLSAMQHFQEAVAKCPKLSRACYELAVCHVMLGRLGTARALLDEAALNNPNSLAILKLQGDVLLELGQWEQAAHVFDRLLALEPESGRASFGLARAYAGLQSSAEQCRAALDALDTAVRLGVRDRRLVENITLVLNDGRQVQGYITEKADGYVVRGGGDKSQRIEKAQVKEVRREPPLQEQLLALLQRFKDGKQPEPRPLIRGGKTARQAQPKDTLSPWGTILGQ